MDTEKKTDEVARNLLGAGFALDPGPHVVLYVIRFDARYTETEYSLFKVSKSVGSDSVIRGFASSSQGLFQ